jgi:uncharacterized protein YceH (UPF0502 family)
MKKMVNGEVVDMSPDEITRREAEDAAFADLQANPPPPVKTVEQEIVELKQRLVAVESKTAEAPK